MGTFCTTTSVSIKMQGTSFTGLTALASQCITDAENEIKKCLSKRYDLTSAYFNTTTSIPPMVQTMCLDLTVGYMYENMARGSKEGYARADRYIKRVMENLMAIQDGTLALCDTTGSLLPESTTEWTIYNSTDYTPTFAEDDPKDWAVDQDKLDDIDDDRS